MMQATAHARLFVSMLVSERVGGWAGGRAGGLAFVFGVCRMFEHTLDEALGGLLTGHFNRPWMASERRK